MSANPHHPPVGSLVPFPDADALADSACEAFCDLAAVVTSENRPFRVSLSGGSTPKKLYQKLAQRDLPWEHIDWFFGDERNVPLDHEDSNFRMVHEALLEPARVPKERIHVVPIQPEHPELAARQYEDEIRRVFELQTESDVPIFDLVLLGMGDDAHTASLFPGTTALQVRDRLFVENYVPKMETVRLTQTIDVINGADNIWFMITGANKREALQHVWKGPRDSSQFPSQLVQPEEGILWWMVSEDALGTGEE